MLLPVMRTIVFSELMIRSVRERGTAVLGECRPRYNNFHKSKESDGLKS